VEQVAETTTTILRKPRDRGLFGWNSWLAGLALTTVPGIDFLGPGPPINHDLTAIRPKIDVRVV